MNLYRLEYTIKRPVHTQIVVEYFCAKDNIEALSKKDKILNLETETGYMPINTILFLIGTKVI